MNTALKPMYEWETINWAKVQRNVFKLQKRIYQASERGDVKAVRKLQRLLTNSWYAKVLAVRKVTQDNKGKNTPGIDGVKRLRNHQKIKLAKVLHFNDKSQPTKRVWIPKPGKEEKKTSWNTYDDRQSKTSPNETGFGTRMGGKIRA